MGKLNHTQPDYTWNQVDKPNPESQLIDIPHQALFLGAFSLWKFGLHFIYPITLGEKATASNKIKLSSRKTHLNQEDV